MIYILVSLTLAWDDINQNYRRKLEIFISHYESVLVQALEG